MTIFLYPHPKDRNKEIFRLKIHGAPRKMKRSILNLSEDFLLNFINDKLGENGFSLPSY